MGLCNRRARSLGRGCHFFPGEREVRKVQEEEREVEKVAEKRNVRAARRFKAWKTALDPSVSNLLYIRKFYLKYRFHYIASRRRYL